MTLSRNSTRFPTLLKERQFFNDAEHLTQLIKRQHSSFIELRVFSSVVDWERTDYLNLGCSLLVLYDGDYGLYADVIPINLFIIGIKKIKKDLY